MKAGEKKGAKDQHVMPEKIRFGRIMVDFKHQRLRISLENTNCKNICDNNHSRIYEKKEIRVQRFFQTKEKKDAFVASGYCNLR